MIELISIICALIVCIVTPIEVGKIRGGWVNKKYENDRAKFIEIYSKQLRMLTFVGLGFGVVSLGLILIEDNPGERIVKLVAAAIWFAVSGVCFVYHGRLPAEA